jgi:hypothetical protein
MHSGSTDGGSVGECGDARESGDLVGGPCDLCQGVLGVDEDEPESELVLEGVVLEDVVLEDVVLEDVVLEDVEESELVVDAESDDAEVVEELEEPRASFL